MPFYEYECSNCKFYTEVMQKISDAPLTKCPSCGKQDLKKLVSAPNFRLKGGGWYETDFKGEKENRRNLAGPDKEESSKPEPAADSSKSETPKAEPSKPAATVETSSKAVSASGGGSRSSTGAKASSGKSGVKSAKPVGKVAASKSRTAAAVRGKAKPVAARKKKSRR